MGVSRRSFLRGLVGIIAAPAIVRAELIMPVRPLPLPYLPGDLVNFKVGLYRATGIYAVCEPVRRVERSHIVFVQGYGQLRREVRVPAEFVELFHGLPGNRVDNPSMRHRLVRQPGRLGLSYPEDIT